MRATALRMAVLLSVCASAPAGAMRDIVYVEEAVETNSLEIRLDEQGQGKVAGRACNKCELQEFPVTPATQALQNNQPVDLSRALNQRGKPATIIYNLESGNATRILWWQ